MIPQVPRTWSPLSTFNVEIPIKRSGTQKVLLQKEEEA
jgi:hypothetical protein